MKKITLFGVMALLCLWVNAQPQNLKPLNIGDTVPDIKLANLYDSTNTPVNLSSFKNQLVILDFWSTWCRPCVSSLPKLDSLQNTFAGNLKIILLTRDFKERVEEFLQSRKIKLELPLFKENDSLLQWFPHQSIPHLVWISTNGTLLGLTDKNALTQQNVLRCLAGKKPINTSTLQKNQL